MQESITLFAGFDPREACVYHVFCQSVLEKSSTPVFFCPLTEDTLQFDGQQDGSNAFIYSRYLVPHLMDFGGWALFCDGDMICNTDIAELWNLRDETKAVQVVKHDYKTISKRKYIGTPLENDNVDYPRKNWSSVILWNCGHPSNRILSREFVSEAGGKVLHRFDWLNDEEIGELPLTWNYLDTEYPPKEAKIDHHTLGSPGFNHYSECPSAQTWHDTLLRTLNMEGEEQMKMLERAYPSAIKAWKARYG